MQWYINADTNSPANSAIIVVPMATAGTEAQGQDLATLADIEADPNFSERTTGNWNRKELESAQLAAATVDHGNNRFPLAVPVLLWSSPNPSAGNNIVGVVICYDSDTTSNPDSAIIPITFNDAAVTTDGNQVQINASDFLWNV